MLYRAIRQFVAPLWRHLFTLTGAGVASFFVCVESSKDVCFHYTAIRHWQYRLWYRLQYRRYHTDTAGIGRYPIPNTGISLSLE